MSNLKRRKIAHSSLHDMLRDPDIQAEEIQAFLERDKSSINEVDRRGKTPLSVVLETGNCSVSILNILLKYGGDVNFRDKYGSSLLMKAIEYSGDETIIKVLLEALDASAVNEVDRFCFSPLLLAMLHRRSANNVNIVKLLIQYGADVRRKVGSGFSLLHVALRSDLDETVIKVMLEALDATHVNEVDRINITLLQLAVRHNRSTNIVKQLLLQGADVSHRDSLGRSVLKMALEGNCDEATVKLLTKYSCLKIENFDIGLSLEGAASFAADCKREVRDMVSVDVGNGRTLRQVVSEHSSPHACVANENEESRNILNQLLERRLDVVCPIYFDMILVKVKKQAMVTKLQEAVLHSITDFSSVSGLEKVLSIEECAFGISQYLPNDTLFGLLRMFYIPH